MTKRQSRRNRWRHKAYLNYLDKIARERIHRSYLQSMATWGATRCPDCGVQVRPHHLLPGGDVRVPRGILTLGAAPQCDLIGNCKGRVVDDWEAKASDRFERRHL